MAPAAQEKPRTVKARLAQCRSCGELYQPRRLADVRLALLSMVPVARARAAVDGAELGDALTEVDHQLRMLAHELEGRCPVCSLHDPHPEERGAAYVRRVRALSGNPSWPLELERPDADSESPHGEFEPR